MSITVEAVALQEVLDAQVQAVDDAQTRMLVAAWVAAWAEVSGDLQDTLEELLAGAVEAGDRVLGKATLRRSLRLRVVLSQIADRLEELTRVARVRVTSDLRAVVDAAAATQRSILNAQLPLDVDTDAVDLLDLTGRARGRIDRALDAIVTRSTQQITSRTRPLSADAERAVRRELIRGVAVGTSPRDTARRMVRRAEREFDGGLGRALNIARTETVDAHRAAAKAEQDEHADVLAGWIWLCHLSPRTCASCLVKHGTFHELDEPGPEDHPQGRCSRMAKVKPWAELGIEGVEEPPDTVADGRAYFDALSEADQVAILGRRRLELLRSGAVTWADLTMKRAAVGWRDSWVMTPLRDLLAGGQSSAGRKAS